jgi:hypothetical protein
MMMMMIIDDDQQPAAAAASEQLALKLTRGFARPCQLRPYRCATANAVSTQAPMKRSSST